MGWIGLIGEGVSLLAQNSASNSASHDQQKGSQAAIDEQRREFDLMRAGLLPYTNAGTGGINGLTRLANGDYSGFANSPDYKYALEQMISANDHSAAAHYRLGSGGYPADLAHDVNGLASGNLGNYRNSLQYLASLGENAAAGVGTAGMNMANQIGGQYNNIGNAQANNALSQGNNWANAINQFASSYASMNHNNNSSSSGNGWNWNTPNYNTNVGWVDYNHPGGG